MTPNNFFLTHNPRTSLVSEIFVKNCRYHYSKFYLSLCVRDNVRVSLFVDCLDSRLFMYGHDYIIYSVLYVVLQFVNTER